MFFLASREGEITHYKSILRSKINTFIIQFFDNSFNYDLNIRNIEDEKDKEIAPNLLNSSE